MPHRSDRDPSVGERGPDELRALSLSETGKAYAMLGFSNKPLTKKRVQIIEARALRKVAKILRGKRP